MFETPSEMAATGTARSDAPKMLWKPAVCMLRWSQHGAARRQAETANVELDAEWIAEMMFVVAADLDARLVVGDRCTAGHTEQQFARRARCCIENALQRRVQRGGWQLDNGGAGSAHMITLLASAL